MNKLIRLIRICENIASASWAKISQTIKRYAYNFLSMNHTTQVPIRSHGHCITHHTRVGSANNYISHWPRYLRDKHTHPVADNGITLMAPIQRPPTYQRRAQIQAYTD